MSRMLRKVLLDEGSVFVKHPMGEALGKPDGLVTREYPVVDQCFHRCPHELPLPLRPEGHGGL